MRGIRRHLRAFAMLYVVCQTAQMAALAPADCCVGHRAPAATSATCHEEAPATQCAMRGMCGGPFAALLVLLSNQGILSRPAETTPNVEGGAAPAVLRERRLARLDPPDPLPPRA